MTSASPILAISKEEEKAPKLKIDEYPKQIDNMLRIIIDMLSYFLVGNCSGESCLTFFIYFTIPIINVKIITPPVIYPAIIGKIRHPISLHFIMLTDIIPTTIPTNKPTKG